MSAIGLAALVGREALKTKAYLDSVGIWTIGVGHTAAAGAPIPYKGLTITRDEALAVFARDLQSYEDAVRDGVTVPLAVHQFDALASICFKIGQGWLKDSSFVKRINAGAMAAHIRAAILAWKKPPRSSRGARPKPYAIGSQLRGPLRRESRSCIVRPDDLTSSEPWR